MIPSSNLLNSRAFVGTNPKDEPITSGLSLALIGNASGQTFGWNRDLDPRRF
jgi:hypothetical protein